MTVRRDFLAFTAGAVVARTVLPLAARAEPGAHPDAALIAACELHPARLAAYNVNPDDMLGDSMAPTVNPGDLVAVLPGSGWNGDGLYVADEIWASQWWSGRPATSGAACGCCGTTRRTRICT